MTIMAPPRNTVAWTMGKSRKAMPVQQAPHAGPREDGLHDHGHVDHQDEVDAGQGEHGDQRVLEGVLADDQRLRQPLSRASFTYSEPSTSSIDERVSRMWAAAKNQPRAKAGMRNVEPARPEDGSQPR